MTAPSSGPSTDPAAGSSTDPSAAPPRLIADAMLGALARWLRVLGVDTAYDPSLDDPELAERAVAEDRLLLTRDRRLVERRALAGRHLLIASEVVDEQVRQVLAALALEPTADDLFTRCLRCNAPLEPIDAASARRHVPPFVARTQERFRRCPACRRLYWRGTHARRMRRRLERMGVLGGVEP